MKIEIVKPTPEAEELQKLFAEGPNYIPEEWVMRKDDIYAAQTAIKIAIDHIEDAIKTCETSLFYQDGPTRVNQKYLEILKNERLICEKALQGLQTPYR